MEWAYIGGGTVAVLVLYIGWRKFENKFLNDKPEKS